MSADKLTDISIRDFSFSYLGSNKTALDNVCLDIFRGERVAIIGPNGSGKTTLAYAVAGIIPHLVPGNLRGSIQVLGREASTAETVFEFARETSVLLQNPEAQLLSLTVEDELLLSRDDSADGPVLTKDEMRSMLDRFGIGHLLKRSVRNLSMGEMQRVAIVSAFARRPRLIVWDEPTAALDIDGIEIARAELSNNQHQATQFIVTHDLSWAQTGCSRVVGIKSGKMLFDKSSATLDKSDLAELHSAIGSGQMLAAVHRILELRGTSSQPASAVRTLSLNDVCYRYQGSSKDAVTKLNCEVERGKTFCLVGHNGSGKSTVLQLLAGIRKPTSGSILINGEPLSRVRRREDAPRFVSLLQNPARQLVGESIRLELRNWIRDGKHKVPLEADIIDAVCSALGDVSPDSDPRSLSFGWQRVFTLLCTLCSDAYVYLIDEPELALDSSMQEFAIEIIDLLARQLNRVVVLSCHSPSFVERVAKTVAILESGKFVYVGERQGAEACPKNDSPA